MFDKNVAVLVNIALVINIDELAFGNGRRTQVLRELQRKVLRAQALAKSVFHCDLQLD